MGVEALDLDRGQSLDFGQGAPIVFDQSVVFSLDLLGHWMVHGNLSVFAAEDETVGKALDDVARVEGGKGDARVEGDKASATELERFGGRPANRLLDGGLVGEPGPTSGVDVACWKLVTIPECLVGHGHGLR